MVKSPAGSSDNRSVGSGIDKLEQQLDSFDSAVRRRALASLLEKVDTGAIDLPAAGSDVNLHCHTFFSHNTYGYSPSHYAWLARRAGLAVAGIVDFDVLDGLDEFLQAGLQLGLKACVGIETRVFVPEFADREINSPGEPGIAYHMGVGIGQAAIMPDREAKFLLQLRQTAQQRNHQLMQRVNDYLQPVQLDYDRDVLPLTPAGNPTERHLCLAYARRARCCFKDDKDLLAFWTEKLAVDPDDITRSLPEGKDVLNLIRAKTMKRGGVGYVPPDKGSFCRMEDFNQFILAIGGIPTLAWLDGTSQAEQHIQHLLDVAVSTGVAAINIIPDRNYQPGVQDDKLANLYEIVEIARQRHLPISVGTEMNSPGQKFVDHFHTAELAPLLPVFLEGAYIIYAHSVLERQCGLGYTGKWAMYNFRHDVDKNAFYADLGNRLQPQHQEKLTQLKENAKPSEILDCL